MLPQSDAFTRPMSVQSPPPARAISLRVSLRRRIEQWRADLPGLQIGTMAIGGRIRVVLSRELGSLVAECEALTRIVDEMALASDGRSWHSARDRGEQGWSDLVTHTADLRLRIERQKRRGRQATKAGKNGAAAAPVRPLGLNGLRIWGGLLVRWGTLIRNEGLKLTANQPDWVSRDRPGAWLTSGTLSSKAPAGSRGHPR